MTMQTFKATAGRLVSRKHVDTLIRSYKHSRWLQNTERLGKPDSLSAWFTLDNLQEFLEMAKAHAADGIKIYFGAYPDQYEQKPEYSGRQTVVLVATKEKKNAAGRNANKDLYYQKNGKPEILAFDNATLCPPNCGEEGNGMDGDNIGILIFENKDGLRVL
jgi:hypothetical protein